MLRALRIAGRGGHGACRKAPAIIAPFSSSMSSSAFTSSKSSAHYAAFGLLSLAGATVVALSPGAESHAAPQIEEHDEQEEPSGRARTKKKRRQNLKLFSGNGNEPLASKISQHLQVPLGKCTIGKFSDGETQVEFHENVRGDSCYIIQSTCTPVNDNIMELLLMISALRRASAKYITAVIPYYGYKRDVGIGHNTNYSQREALSEYHDRSQGGTSESVDLSLTMGKSAQSVSEAIVPVSSSEVATMLEAMGVDRVISVDLQPPGKGQIEGFFGTRVPVDSIQGTFAGVEYFRDRIDDRVVVVAPNETCVKKAEHMQAGLRGSGYRWRDGALRKMKVGLALCIVGSEISENSRHHFNRVGRQVGLSDVKNSPSDMDPLDYARRAAESSEVTVVGDVENCDVIIVDDLISSGGTVVTRARQLRAAGARRIYVFATHGVFCGNALERIGREPDIHEVVVTDTVPLPKNYDRLSRGKVVQVSVSSIVASVISRMHHKESLRDTHLTSPGFLVASDEATHENG